MSDKIFLSPPHVGPEELEYVKRAMESNWIAPAGPDLDAFEEETTKACEVKYAVATTSATASIHIALVLLEICPEDTVLCSDLTFIGSANPILYMKAKPIFVDSEETTWNICPHALELALEDCNRKNKLPKALIAVNLFGMSCSYKEIQAICRKYSIPIIEDAAESLGSKYCQKPSGAWGDISALSFNGNKIITSSGGGMLLTDHSEYAGRARFLITQARDNYPWYHHSSVGYNYRMSNISAAIGRAQLTKLHSRVEARRRIFDHYKKELEIKCDMTFMPEVKDNYPNRWLSTAYFNNIESRKVIAELNKKNIEARHIWMPMHMQPLFKDCHFYSVRKKPLSTFLFEKGICLPSGSSMSHDQIRRVETELQKSLQTQL